MNRSNVKLNRFLKKEHRLHLNSLRIAAIKNFCFTMKGRIMKIVFSAFLVVCFIIGSFAQDGSITGITPDNYVLGAGTGMLQGVSADDPAYQFFGGRIWGLTDNVGLTTVAEATTDWDAVLASALVGANFYPLSLAGNVAPYIGAGAGLGYANGGGADNDFGFDASGVLGVLLFQSSPVKLKVETSANFLFRDIAGDMPMTWTGRVGLLF